MTEPEPSEYDFEVAVSFAGEDREYVERIVERVKLAGVRVFLDSDYLAETWGEDLVEFFDGVYRKRSRYVMMFISSHYATKMWPRHERRSALARALEQRGAYVLPVRLDDTELDGLRPTVGYIDARMVGMDGIVKATLSKVQGGPHSSGAINRVPRIEAEQQLLVLDKPPGWEYLLLASELLRQRDALDRKFHDHEMRYGASTGRFIRREDVAEYLDAASAEALRLSGSLAVVMDPAAQERALGRPGESGDPERIVHLAKRWTAVYEGFMDWASALRGTAIPSEFDDVVEALARYSEASVENYRVFVDRLVEQVDRVPAALEAGEHLTIQMAMVLEIPEDVSAAFDEAMSRVRGI